ncbi:MAG: tetratricopeptide repeat protein [Methylophaga sp.]|nr:tetratricopeptide repeat protein [Methylophaga sp.]
MTKPENKEIDDARQQARDKHMAGDTLAAVALLTHAMQLEPSNIDVAMDMTQIFIDLNEFEQAKGLFNQLPDESKDSAMGKSLMGQLTFLELATKTQGKAELQQLLLAEPNNCDAHFDLATCLIAERSYTEAVDHLFKVIDIDPDYKETAAREMIINVAKMLAPNNPELSSKIHRKLSSATWM